MSEFTGSFEELRDRLRSLSSETAPSPEIFEVETNHADLSGHVKVTIASGRLKELSIDPRWIADTHPARASETIVATVNDALLTNEQATARLLAENSPTYADLQRLVEHTSSDLTAAFEASMRRMGAK